MSFVNYLCAEIQFLSTVSIIHQTITITGETICDIYMIYLTLHKGKLIVK